MLEPYPLYYINVFVFVLGVKCGLEEEFGSGHAHVSGNGDDTFIGHGVALVVLGR